ncbi:MAG: hypothetical protein LBV40_00565, partial [Methanomicrobiales archaeon]|nr:hypothetical protein [Methanomicrobiales archaeon]
MIKKSFFHIIFIITLAITLPACAVSAVDFVTTVATDVTITTAVATDVTATEAILHGEITDIAGEPSVDVFFKYGTSPAALTSSTPPVTLLSAGVFDAAIFNLEPYTFYYYRACATTATGDGCVIPPRMFKTPSLTPRPEIFTDAAAVATATGITLNGHIDDMGGEPSLNVFFKYGTDFNLGVYSRAKAGTLLGTGVFSATISDLNPEISYYFQACTTT